MEIAAKFMFSLFTLLMFNYVRTMGKYDIHRVRFVAYVYMITAAIMAVQV